MNSEIYKKNNLAENFHENEDKKIIEMLKIKNDDLNKQLGEALVKYYECEFRTQRAENLKEDYGELIQKKILENKELLESNESLNNEISALTNSLNFIKKEMERFNTENSKLLDEDKLKSKKINTLEKRVELLTTRLEKCESENGNYKLKFMELNDTIEMQKLTIERNKKLLGEKGNDNTSKELSGKSTNHQMEQKLNEQKDEIIKLQLNIYDLKKRLSEDEKIRNNLFDVIKNKKQKNKDLKFEINKIAFENKETVNMNNWSQELVMQKESTIKVQKEKINNLLNENKNLNKLLHKVNGISKADKCIETDAVVEDVYVRVKPQPTVFKTLV